MLEEILETINNGDYATADRLLTELQEQDPTNPWISFYHARLLEAEGKTEEAHHDYLTLLRTLTHPKIIAQARLGINRITQIEKNHEQEAQSQRKFAIKEAMTTTGSEKMGILVLEAISAEAKQAAAQKFAQIMAIDAYSARLQLPSRSWRLYRTGAMGMLTVYAEALNKAEIPCFCVPIVEVNQITVYPVLFIESIDPQVTVVYEPHKGQRDIFSFDWSRVSQRVEGMLPIFEEYVERGLRGKMERKIKISDYAKVCDLHLPSQKAIIRICDQSYQFHQGYAIKTEQVVAEGQNTKRDYWIYFQKFMEQKLPNVKVWSDFTPFAENALNFAELLKQIDPHINFMRREETPWDAAFALYSGLAFLKPHKAQQGYQ